MKDLCFHLLRRGLFCVIGTLLLPACTLSADDVEPTPPAGPINQANTVTYYLNGQPVVAHNYTDLATAVLLPFLGPFGPGQPVRAQLQPDGTLSLSCVDDQNVVRPGFVQHALAWQLRGFGGVGRYAPLPAATVLRLAVRDAADTAWQPGPTQPLTTAPAEVVITTWDPATRHLRGTFRLEFAAVSSAPAAIVTAGQFDLTLAL